MANRTATPAALFHCGAVKQTVVSAGLRSALDERVGDRALIERCLAGNEAAFRELVDTYKRMVFAIISRSTSDRHNVEDLAQDVFVRVHRGLRSFRGDARLSTWICRIAMNVCADGRPRAPREVSLDAAPTGALPPPAIIVSDPSFAALELRDHVAKGMALLSERSRLVLTMHYFAGRGYEEIADALQVPLGTVKTHLHRAKQQLREILERRDDA
jgi:RNA polymerase sigma-70 factor, ECF subfamily